jgi:opacity protein-like surface antigen
MLRTGFLIAAVAAAAMLAVLRVDAVFRANGTGSAKVGSAGVHWHLKKGSRARLVEENGHFSWS